MAAIDNEQNEPDVSRKDTSFTQCPYCKVRFLSYAFQSHLQRCQIAKVPKVSKPITHSTAADSKAKAQKPIKVLILRSRRGSRIQNKRQYICDECRDYEAQWSYAESNCGRVYLCNDCKQMVYERSFGKSDIDIMDVAFLGGGIDSNRRKH